MPAKRALLLALLAGLVSALALPPWHLIPALFGFALLDHLLASSDRFWPRFRLLWVFAFGFFVVGLHWIAIAFYADAERFGAFAVPGVAALSAILATIAAVACTPLVQSVGDRRWARAVMLALGWTLAELLRGPWGTQFPWNPVASVWAFSDAMLQSVGWFGTQGLGFLTLLAVIVIGQGLVRRALVPTASGVLVLALLYGAGVAHLPGEVEAATDRPVVRIVQPNIAQHHKWDPDKRRAWFFEHVNLSKPGAGEADPDILIWPESSVPYSIDQAAEVGPLITEYLKPGAIALVGSDFIDREQEPVVLHNSVYALDAGGQIIDRYDKVNLVPFGEFLPFRQLLAPLGLAALAVGSVDFSAGPERRTMALGELPRVGALVCFEAVFPGRSTHPQDRPDWLLNITNDGWFGISAGPYQHLAMARMRAVETGLPLVRAANTGISVVTDGFGRIRQRLDLGARGSMTTALPEPRVVAPPVGRHPLVQYGALAVLVALALAPAWASDARQRSVRPLDAGI